MAGYYDNGLHNAGKSSRILADNQTGSTYLQGIRQ